MLSDLSILQFALIAFSAMFIGFGKAGIVGAGMVTIPIFAAVLGGKPSTGFVLPLLIIADFTAILFYSKNTKWIYLLKLAPWVIAGIIIGTLAGKYATNDSFDILLATVILIGVALMLLKDFTKIPQSFFEKKGFTITMGILGGFSSIIGNAAGNIMSIFLLSVNLPKKEFIATRAWFFFLFNIIKLPIHIFYWETITQQTLYDDLILLPFIAIGMALGFWAVKYINEAFFKKMVIALVIISALALFFK